MGQHFILLLAVTIVQLLATQTSAEMLLPADSIGEDGSGDVTLTTIESMEAVTFTLPIGPSSQTDNPSILPVPSSTEDDFGEETTMMDDDTSSLDLDFTIEESFITPTPTPTPDATSSVVANETSSLEILSTSSSAVIQPSSTLAVEMTTPVVTPTPTPTSPPTLIPLHLRFINLNNPVLLRKGFDSSSGTILIDGTGFPTFGATVPHTRVFVSDNGVISFRNSFFFYIPSLFPTSNSFIRDSFVVAPFWSDVDNRIEGTVQYQVFNAVTDNATISEVSSYISQAINSSFNGLWMLVAEWRDVHPFPHGSEIPGFLPDYTNSTNTFQSVVITDGSRSYAVFLYKCGLLQWSGLDNFYRHAVIGYNMNGQFINHPRAGMSAVRNVVCANSPATPWSTLIYPIGDLEDQLQQARVECIRRYDADIVMFGPTGLRSRVSCPCSMFQAVRDRRFQQDFERSVFTFDVSVLCFSARFPITRGDAQGQLCCYSSSFFSRDFGALLIEGQNPSSATAFHRRFSRQQYLVHDLEFHNACCRQADRCDLFRERRLSNNCFRYFPPFWAWFFGDPHINTLDGRMYTFNGRGEYTLVQLGDQFELQARTEPVNSNTTATQFTACAMASPTNGTKIELRLESASLMVLVDNIDVTADLQATNDSLFYGDNTISVNQTSPNTVAVTFMSDISVEITAQVGLLSFVVTLPQQFMMDARGLLGNFDGNSTNDFIFRNGTMIPDSSTDREIHNFGQSWQITASDSLFSYPNGSGAGNFSDPGHMPVFLDELSDAAIANARSVCGNDSQCIYDFSQTGNEELAMVTMTTNEVNVMDMTISSNLPPRLNGSEEFMVTVGQMSVYQFTASDTDNFTLSANTGGLPNTLVKAGPDMYNFTFDVSAVINSTVSFVASDTLNASSLLDPQLLVCACNSGNCTLEGLLDRDSDPLIMNCLCSEAYTGRFCEEDVNGCSEITCFEGVNCTDNLAPQTGATCGPCPTGLEGDGMKCVDIDECVANSHNCQQDCINTEGGFMCGCRMGFEFEMNNMTHCRDINECSRNSDNCDQLCTNTEGGFNCSCNDGFILQFDMSSCIVDPNRNCSIDNSCQQLCVRNTNTTTEVCLCMNGFTLDANMTNCNDVDECSSSSSNPCTQNCTNGDGNFTCSCTSGYRLGSDGFTCEDINECEQAAMNSMQICNNTLQCVNLIGSFMCQCPAGSELNSLGVCVVIQTPTTTTVAPMSSTVVAMTTTPTPVIPSPTPPVAAVRNEVVVVVTTVTELTFTAVIRENFRRTVATATTRYCQNNSQRCRELFSRKRSIAERQTITVQPSDVVITLVMNTAEGLRIQFYIRGMSGGVIHQNDIVEALRNNMDLFRDAGFTIASVMAVGAPPELSVGAIVGIVVGGVVAILLILLVLLLVVFCCWKMCCKNDRGGKYEFAAQKSAAQFASTTSGEVVIQNAAFDAERPYHDGEKMRERDDISVHSVTLKFGGDNSDEEEFVSSSREKNGIEKSHDEKETFL